MKNLPKALIFDMDGTMINSEPYMQKAREILYERFGVPLSYEQTIKTGIHKREYWSDLKNTYSITYSVDELIAIEQEESATLIKKAGVTASTGLNTLLEFAKNNGIKVGCASSSIKSYVLSLLSYLKIDGYFEAICTGDDQISPKPAPDPYLTVCKKLGVEPKDTIAFEDSYLGTLSAKNASVSCVGYREHALNADFSECFLVIERMDDIIKIWQ